MVEGIFHYRKNRRLAEVEVSGERFDAYVTNSVDLRFLKEGTKCILREAESLTRSTAFDLYAVYDGNTLVCIDAKEALRVGMDWVINRLVNEEHKEEAKLLYDDTKSLNFYVTIGGLDQLLMVQVMGTSLVKGKAAYLPEMPSSALNKRLESLLLMKDKGKDVRLLFVACREDAEFFTPNYEADPVFIKLLLLLDNAGVPIECLRCRVDAEGMKPEQLIPVKLLNSGTAG
ncbi:MAG: DNA/RNA nuclease SfsA [Clostridia bacterium]|nr:DNA/RNA nuclease SfsA [Clostridia bacterium]